ncbi:hypothetical protein NIES2104_12330 [Leptolyngbya sp. NIES-2104]|nr:hypothetical protein NIES2104_12330 [Leptolyngbya sp. NIES-2104]
MESACRAKFEQMHPVFSLGLRLANLATDGQYQSGFLSEW